MTAKEYLNRLKKLDKLIENKLAEREQWYAMATSTTAAYAPETGVRVQTSGSKQQMANAMDKYIDIGKQIDSLIDKLYDERKQIIGVIEELETTEYDVLHKMYVGVVKDERRYYMDFNEIAILYDKSYSWATWIHGIALKNVQRIIDNCKQL